jgi:hypothetical protein
VCSCGHITLIRVVFKDSSSPLWLLYASKLLLRPVMATAADCRAILRSGVDDPDRDHM